MFKEDARFLNGEKTKKTSQGQFVLGNLMVDIYFKLNKYRQIRLYHIELVKLS